MMAYTNEVEELISHIDGIDRISDEDWQLSLNDRKRKELEFHDCERDKIRVEEVKAQDTYEKFYGNKKYYTAVKRSNQYMNEWIARESKGKIFLDYACGNGGLAILPLKLGHV